MRLAVAYPVTPEYVVRYIDEFLSMEDGMNQSRLAVLLVNRTSTSHYRYYGFLTFQEWMKYLGYPVLCNRVWSRR